MNYLYLMAIILGLSMQNVVKKAYTEKCGGGVYFFSTLTSLSATLFFVLNSGGVEWNAKVVPYAVAFATAYTLATVFSVLAIQYGSLSITSLVISYSLLLPALYGLIFLKESISFGFWPGVLLLIISLVLINGKSEKLSITWKWIIFVLLAFLGNGFCTIFQKMQQMAFEGSYKNEFMIIALATVTVVLGIFVIGKERKQILQYTKKGWLYGVLSGLFNGAVNLSVMLLSARMPASLMFPLISAGGIIVTYIISKIFYKEELTKKQFIGFVFGIVSVIFLNI